MKSSLRHKLTTILLCASLLLLPKSANADELKNDAIKAGVAIGFVGAAIGVGIYYLVRRAPSITGCAVSSPGGLSLQNEGDRQTYMLIGDIANIKTGDRIRISGKKNKKDASGKRDFHVEKLTKDYGPCTAS